jgi:NADPH-dependent F420 reductase
MKIAIIGSGTVGRALTKSLRAAGHDVVVASAHPDHAAELADQLGATAELSTTDAVQNSEIVVLAVPFASAGKDVAEEIRPAVDGKIVIDVTNPVSREMKLVTNGTSAAEEFQRWLPNAKLVKAFNTLFASRQEDPDAGGTELDGFVAADDADAKQKVMDLVSSLGMRPIDAGDLSVARTLEGMALLNMKVQIAHGWSWRSAWKLVD